MMRKYKRPAPLKGTADQKVEQLRRDMLAFIAEVERDVNTIAGAERKEKESAKK